MSEVISWRLSALVRVVQKRLERQKRHWIFTTFTPQNDVKVGCLLFSSIWQATDHLFILNKLTFNKDTEQVTSLFSTAFFDIVFSAVHTSFMRVQVYHLYCNHDDIFAFHAVLHIRFPSFGPLMNGFVDSPKSEQSNLGKLNFPI